MRLAIQRDRPHPRARPHSAPRAIALSPTSWIDTNRSRVLTYLASLIQLSEASYTLLLSSTAPTEVINPSSRSGHQLTTKQPITKHRYSLTIHEEDHIYERAGRQLSQAARHRNRVKTWTSLLVLALCVLDSTYVSFVFSDEEFVVAMLPLPPLMLLLVSRVHCRQVKA
jgi:hypothetical protein